MLFSSFANQETIKKFWALKSRLSLETLSPQTGGRFLEKKMSLFIKLLRNSEPSNPGWAKKLWALKLVDGFLKKKKCNHEDNIDKGVSLENPYFSPKYVE